MPRFGAGSTARLEQLHPDLVKVFREVIKEMDFTVTETHRSQERQDHLFNTRDENGNRRTKVKWPNSKHNPLPSMAADIAPWPVDYSQREEFTLLAGLVLGTSHQMLKNGEITHRVRWGGDWDSDYDLDDNKFDDLPHFELVEVT